MNDYGFHKELPEDDKRQALFKEQRETRGFDDTETWSLCSSMAKFVIPRLERFKTIHICHPGSITMEEWDGILQEMIDGFKEVNKMDFEEFDEAKVNRGLELFAEWYLDLWW